jgi:8-oxo-dGTP diphosphatase
MPDTKHSENVSEEYGDNPEDYDPDEFEHPSVTVDDIIFTVTDDNLKVALIQRSRWPHEGKWALPGGFVDMDESLESAADRVLQNKTGISSSEIYMEQLYTFGEPDRDPRTRVITVGYFALVNQDEVNLRRTEEVKDIEWHSVYDLPELGFDHEDIIEYALKRLRWKIEYSTAVFSLLPEKFTLSRLQEVYEIILDEEMDKRNFRKKIHKHDLVEETGEREKNVSHRPAKLYRANRELGEIVEIL